MERLTKRELLGGHNIAYASGDDCFDVWSVPKKFMGNAIDRLAYIEDILGDNYDLSRLRDLVQADREGRCVVLPCKPSGVTVYQLRNKKHARGRGVSPRHIGCATVWSGGHYQLEHQGFEPCRDRDFGITWFLDEDAAEEALKGEERK